MQINFNFSFPHLSCEYASVDATNFMGTHDAGLAARVSKIHLDKSGRQLGPHKERRKMKHDEHDSIVQEDENKSLLLTTATFERARLDHEVKFGDTCCSRPSILQLCIFRSWLSTSLLRGATGVRYCFGLASGYSLSF